MNKSLVRVCITSLEEQYRPSFYLEDRKMTLLHDTVVGWPKSDMIDLTTYQRYKNISQGVEHYSNADDFLENCASSSVKASSQKKNIELQHILNSYIQSTKEIATKYRKLIFEEPEEEDRPRYGFHLSGVFYSLSSQAPAKNIQTNKKRDEKNFLCRTAQRENSKGESLINSPVDAVHIKLKLGDDIFKQGEWIYTTKNVIPTHSVRAVFFLCHGTSGFVQLGTDQRWFSLETICDLMRLAFPRLDWLHLGACSVLKQPITQPFFVSGYKGSIDFDLSSSFERWMLSTLLQGGELCARSIEYNLTSCKNVDDFGSLVKNKFTFFSPQ